MSRRRRYGFARPHLVALFSLVDGLGSVGVAPARALRPPKWPADPRRILLINFAHIGDVLMVTPALRALRVAHPEAHISVLVGPWSKDVLAACPYMDELLVFRPSWWDRENGAYLRPAELVRLVKLLRRGRFDLSFNFKSFFQENLALRLAGVPARVGYGIYGGGFFLTHQVEHDWGAHTVEKNLALVSFPKRAGETPALPETGAQASRLPVTVEDRRPAIPDETAQRLRLSWNRPSQTPLEASASLPDRPKPEMFVFREDLEAAGDFLRSSLGAESGTGDPASPLIAFHIGAGYPSKLWGTERCAALADALAARWGARILVVGGADDTRLVTRMEGLCRTGLVVAAGRLSIRQTAALLAYCHLFVGNDSGPAHIAAAIGLPVVAIFSGENEAKVWRPYADNCLVIQRHPDCYPCGKRDCDRDHRCMVEITVEEVLAAVGRILGAGPF